MTRACLIGALLWASGLGCYSPAVDSCVYRCSTVGGCPNSLSCNEENWCAASATDRCDDIQGTDAADAPNCLWTVANIDTCARGLEAITDDWTVIAGASVVIDVSTGSVPGLPPSPSRGTADQVDAAHTPAFLIAVHDLTIFGTVTVTSDLPVIFVASGKVTIAGSLSVLPSTTANASCSVMNAGQLTQSGNGAGGGGGGAFGTPGGTGGPGGVQAGSSAGVSAGGNGGITASDQMLTPLHGGCPGGRGGNAGGALGAPGGDAGGGLQISARQSLEITGSVLANGSGGAGSPSVQRGAGGGASGGGILLQAPTVTVSSGRVCANGGGGGGSFALTANGATSDCGPAPAAGASMGTTADRGGDGATGTVSAEPGTPGLNVTAGNLAHGGGGGGGGVGVIRILGTYANTGTSIVSPAPKL